MFPFIKIIRPQQWVKNLFVFLPLFFGGRILDGNAWLDATQAFFAMCFASSGIYCLNDIVDLAEDRKHPHKKLRPIASGAISKNKAYLIMALCFIFSIMAIFPGGVNRLLFATICAYIILQVSYCLWLKKMPIVDLICIAIGFVLRVVAGGVSTGIWISEWIVMMTFMLTLFLATSKRRFDIILKNKENITTRPNIEGYTIEFVNIIVGIIASVTIVCYIMYTVSPSVTNRIGSNYLYITSFFVITSILRYIQQSIIKPDSGSDPTHILLHDHFIQLNLLLWIVSFIIIIYF